MSSKYLPTGMIVMGWLLQIPALFISISAILIWAGLAPTFPNNVTGQVLNGLLMMLETAFLVYYLILARQTRDQRRSLSAKKAFIVAVVFAVMHAILIVFILTHIIMTITWSLAAYYARRAQKELLQEEQLASNAESSNMISIQPGQSSP